MQIFYMPILSCKWIIKEKKMKERFISREWIVLLDESKSHDDVYYNVALQVIPDDNAIYLTLILCILFLS